MCSVLLQLEVELLRGQLTNALQNPQQQPPELLQSDPHSTRSRAPGSDGASSASRGLEAAASATSFGSGHSTKGGAASDSTIGGVGGGAGSGGVGVGGGGGDPKASPVMLPGPGQTASPSLSALHPSPAKSVYPLLSERSAQPSIGGSRAYRLLTPQWEGGGV